MRTDLEKLDFLVTKRKLATESMQAQMSICFPNGASVLVLLRDGQVNPTPATVRECNDNENVHVVLDKPPKNQRGAWDVTHKWIHYTKVKLVGGAQ